MILRNFFMIILWCVSIVLEKTYGSNIPGVPGVDYPNYREIPLTSFRCPESKISGFFPDFETRCQVFHYCEDGNRDTFICPIGSIFNPLIKSCDRWFNFECNAPQPYDERRTYDDRQAGYDVASDGDVAASLFQQGSSLFDKMASLFDEDGPGEAYGQYEIKNGPSVNQYSEYESSEYGDDTMAETEELKREVSGLKQNERLNNGGPFPYGDRDVEGWDSHDSEDDANLKNRRHVHSKRETNMEGKIEDTLREHSESVHGDAYEDAGSYTDHGGQSSKGVLYYRNPTIYNYHTQSNEYNGNQEGDSIFYEGDVNDPRGDSYSSVYDRDVDFDDFDESDVDSDPRSDLQKRISEHRRRRSPKPVVSLIESDLEIVTLPPPRQKRPRISLVQKNGEPAVTEPMMTTKEEPKKDVQHKSETTELSSAAAGNKNTSEDGNGDDESHTSSDIQQKRSGSERDFDDWLTEESSGDAEDFIESADFDDTLDLNQNEEESGETDMEKLHSMMRPNLFYVDSNSDHGVESHHDLSTDTSSDEQYEENYSKTSGYEKEEFDMNNKVQNGEYNHDDKNREIEDSSEVLLSDQFGEHADKDEGTEDFGEMFQTVIDGEIKTIIRFGEEIIDPTEYYPDGKDEYRAERESFYDAMDKVGKKYAEENSDETSYQSDLSQDLKAFRVDQMKKTLSEATNEYSTDYEYSYQDGNSSPDFAADSSGTVSEEVTFSSEYEFPTTEANDMMNADGAYMYDGSSDSDTMENFYKGEDFGYSHDQSYIHPAYTGEHAATFEEQGASDEDTVMSSDEDETSSSDVIYYYSTDMGSQFVTDQPDMDLATTAIIDDEYANTDVQGNSEYAYEVSLSEDSDEEFTEDYFATHSADSDVQFVTDQSDYGTSSTASSNEGHSRDGRIQEQYFKIDSYDSDLGTHFVTDQPDFKMSTVAFDSKGFSKDTDNQEESRITLDMINSEGSDSDQELQEYLQEHSDSSEDDFANEKENNTEQDKAELESDVSSDTLPNILDNMGISDNSKTIDSNFDKSVSSNKHRKISATAQESHSKETSSDFLSVEGEPNFDFDSVEDTGFEKEDEHSKEDSQSSTDESSSEDSIFESQPVCSTCPLSFRSGKRSRRVLASRFEMDGSSPPDRTGKMLEGSKFAKLASFVKKMVAAKKKAKINIVKKILPSSEWNTEA